MGLRRRLTLLTTLVVGGVIVLAAIACYAVIRAELRGQVDDQLTGQGALLERVGRGGPGPRLRPGGRPRRVLPGRLPRAGGAAGVARSRGGVADRLGRRGAVRGMLCVAGIGLA